MLEPGSKIGILGGGQLGRMLAVAATRLGFKSHIFEPAKNSPASQVSFQVSTASYEDEKALIEFAKDVDVITYEFENIPTSALDILEKIVSIRPGREALRISQDRIIEKDFLSDLGLKTAPYQLVEDLSSLQTASKNIGLPAILKTTRLGYDGKGQYKINSDQELENLKSQMITSKTTTKSGGAADTIGEMTEQVKNIVGPISNEELAYLSNVFPIMLPQQRLVLKDALTNDEFDTLLEFTKDKKIKVFDEDMKYLEPADLVVALLTGRDVDSGTAAEIGYAFRAGKKLIGISANTIKPINNFVWGIFNYGENIVDNLDDLKTIISKEFN